MKKLASLPKAAPDGLLAATLLSFLATAGFYYVNIMPALVEGLQTGLGFSERSAGLAGSANVYGAAVGALAASFLVTRWPWRVTATMLLGILIGIDLLSMLIGFPNAMIAMRAVHGLAGGCLVGFAFSVIARTAQPERTFGMLLLVQGILGGLGVMVLPQLVPIFGTRILFAALIGVSLVTLLMLPFLAEYPRAQTGAAHASASTTVPAGSHRILLILALSAVFLFQFANMLLFTYIIGLARHFGLDSLHSATVVGLATWVGMIGSILVVAFGTRFGRVTLLAISLLLTALGMWMLHGSRDAVIYAIANCGTGVTWAFVIPHLLGMCARFDLTGRAAALGGFASKMGLATGPFLGALLLDGTRYGLLIDVGTLGVVLCGALAFFPARRLDLMDRVPKALAG